MKECEAIGLVADALGVAPERVTPGSKAEDFQEWDSMGMLAIVVALQQHGIQLDPGEATELKSVDGILSLLRTTGKLQ
jgi:acyl carrier protein